jgi:tetratricopeptide (TPR) repeat protein
VDEQKIADYASPGLDPWWVLGERMRVLICALGDDPGTRSDLGAARAAAALALTHAGDMAAVKAILDDLVVDEKTPPEIRVIKGIVGLGLALDDEQWQKCEKLARALDADLAIAAPAHRERLMAKVHGTQGRALMQQRRLGEALPLLERAVSEHGQWGLHELGRSRMYLAQALRMAGSYPESMSQLDAAWTDLDENTRRWSEFYYQSCVVYWRYERARLLVEMGRAEEAVAHATEALGEAESGGFWPRLGLLRTLAWAYRLLAREEDAAAMVARMGEISVPESSKGFAARLVEEAKGSVRWDGVVY